MSVFNELREINVNEKVEEKGKLSYLSWAWAWSEVKKKCPTATYTIFKNELNQPYVYDEKTGYMCYTTVTIEDETLEMWLPVMDGSNKAMKSESYTYDSNGWEGGKRVKVKKVVEAATMFDINKTLMRCLTKNLAMFGLGLYIYAGEDLPELTPVNPVTPVTTETVEKVDKPKIKAQQINIDNMKKNIDTSGYESTMIKVNKSYELTEEQRNELEMYKDLKNK